MRVIGLSATLWVTIACGPRRSKEAPAPYRDTSIWVNPSADCRLDFRQDFCRTSRASDTVSDPRGRYDSEKVSVWLARRVPGGWTFGPMVDSIQHRTLLWMRDTSTKRAALAALDTLAPHGPLFVSTYPVTYPGLVCRSGFGMGLRRVVRLDGDSRSTWQSRRSECYCVGYRRSWRSARFRS